MPWFNTRKDHEPTRDNDDTRVDQPAPKPNKADRFLPPHMQRLVDARNEARERQTPDQRRAALERKREGILFDIDQGELAQEPENPWTHRIELLTEALGHVEDDIRRAETAEPEPYAPVPATPITDISVSDADGIAVSFTIGDQRFAYAEVLDWAERGHQVAPPEFRVVESDAAALVPADVPEELREPLTRHLTDSLAVFATDLRDRTLDNEPLPQNPTLADLAKPCPTCGGWMDWRGRCDACTRRKAASQNLLQERNRLLKERSAEAEERSRLVDRLPVARIRLADVERELASLDR